VVVVVAEGAVVAEEGEVENEAVRVEEEEEGAVEAVGIKTGEEEEEEEGVPLVSIPLPIALKYEDLPLALVLRCLS